MRRLTPRRTVVASGASPAARTPPLCASFKTKVAFVDSDGRSKGTTHLQLWPTEQVVLAGSALSVGGERLTLNTQWTRDCEWPTSRQIRLIAPRGAGLEIFLETKDEDVRNAWITAIDRITAPAVPSEASRV